ncbi:flagellar hook-associated protein FlgK [Cohnella rhizosphaerae]|uniref:Flagellar hook-associated protein 1 n=1 Tax=Cohnella rhizosphaerae TaxID=1457232 RepID=A0A9X4KWX6_9BACL|nr:flagellar hook-associated protein FlgK [Cohnella rhizosphaerae]MDG0811861.1 flagellar hook-associated protein FlgK [Cohnella rhizosphaerae]
MRSTFHAIETAKRSLFTQQAALQTTGQNVANANTTGYSRQTVNMVASRPIEAPGLTHSTSPGQLGTGVEFSSITRIRESYLDNQFRNENQNNGSWSIRQDTLQKLETIMNEPTDSGLRSVLDNFFNSWQDLSENPENLTARKLVRENALALTDAINQMNRQFDDLKSDLTTNIGTKVSQMNTSLQTIADLNTQIKRIEAFGDNANDLRDQRDVLVDELSKMANVTVNETADGYQVSMGGQVLVDNGNPTTLEAADVIGAFGSDLTGGELYGMILSRDQYVSSFQSQLDTLVNGLANGEMTVTLPAGSVLPEGTVLNGVTYSGTNRTLASDLTATVKGLNGLHQLGYTNQDPLKAAGAFFVSSDGSPLTAGNIMVSKDIQNDANNIAASMRTATSGGTESVVKGNKNLALLMAQFNDTKINFTSVNPDALTGTGTVNDMYSSIIGQLGIQSQEAQRQTTNTQAVVDQVDARRQAVSGVSLDEEMANLIKFQHAYSAAARFMTTIDETLDKIINGTGVVGR